MLRLVVVAVAVALALLNLHSKATELHCHYCITSTQISYTFSGYPVLLPVGQINASMVVNENIHMSQTS